MAEEQDEQDEQVRRAEQRQGLAPSVWSALLSILLLLGGMVCAVVFLVQQELGWAIFTGLVLWALAALVRKW